MYKRFISKNVLFKLRSEIIRAIKDLIERILWKVGISFFVSQFLGDVATWQFQNIASSVKTQSAQGGNRRRAR